MEDNLHIREKEQFQYLKKEFMEHVIETSKTVKDNQGRIAAMEKGKEQRSKQINKLDKKLDDVIDTLSDSKMSSRKGVITQTLTNTDKISSIENELAAWKRAIVILSALFTGLIFAGKYLFVVLKQLLKGQ